jgi:hypothetical protein
MIGEYCSKLNLMDVLKHELDNLWGEQLCSASLQKVAKKFLLQLTILFHIWNLL